MKILILGAGMYVTGRGNTGLGTVLASLAQTSRSEKLEAIVAARKPSNRRVVQQAVARINKAIGAKLKVDYAAIKSPASLRSLVKQHKFGCAIVALPDHLHFAYTSELLEMKVPCLVVKPLTPTLAEAHKLIGLQDTFNTYGAVEFHKRWDETNLYIKRELGKNTLGKLLYFTVDYSQRISIPLKVFREWASRTNIFQYLGVHYADLIYFLTGFIPVRVSAIGTTGILKSKGVNTFDSVHATIEWQNPKEKGDHFVSTFNTNWIDPDNTTALSDQKYKVVGTRGRFECDQKNRGLELVHEKTGITQVNPYFSEFLPGSSGKNEFLGYGHKSISSFIQDVFDLKAGRTAIRELEKSRPSLRSALPSVGIVEAVNRSLAENSKWTAIGKIN